MVMDSAMQAPRDKKWSPISDDSTFSLAYWSFWALSIGMMQVTRKKDTAGIWDEDFENLAYSSYFVLSCFMLKAFFIHFIASNGSKQMLLWFQWFKFTEFCFNTCLVPCSSFNNLTGKLNCRMIFRKALTFWIWALTSFKRKPQGQIHCSQLGTGFKGTGMRSM